MKLVKLNLKKKLLRVFVICLYICLYTTCVPGARGGQRWASDSVGLKLQMVMSWESNPGLLKSSQV